MLGWFSGLERLSSNRKVAGLIPVPIHPCFLQQGCVTMHICLDYVKLGNENCSIRLMKVNSQFPVT